MLESVEKLRNHIKEYWTISEGQLYNYLDDIEREITERYMLLPVDADGVPIQVGDSMVDVDGMPPLVATSLTTKGFCTYFGTFYSGNTTYHSKKFYVEDVLRELVDVAKQGNVSSELLTKYADELRELLGGDAE